MRTNRSVQQFEDSAVDGIGFCMIFMINVLALYQNYQDLRVFMTNVPAFDRIWNLL